MGNVQVHAAVGAQVASQLLTIPPPLFRSSQREVAAHLLPAHFTTPKRRDDEDDRMRHRQVG
jgi:hypothetical protein